MIAVRCEPCGWATQLRDEYAGKHVRCPRCQSVLEVPESPGARAALAAADAPAGLAPLPAVFRRHRFVLQHKMFTAAESHTVYNEQGQPVLFVRRPAHALRTAVARVLALVLAAALAAGVSYLGATLHTRLPDRPAVTVAVTAAAALAAVVLLVLAAALLRPKRHLTFFEDQPLTVPVLHLTQGRRVASLVAGFVAKTPEGEVLGRLTKHRLVNLLVKKWRVLGPDGRLLGVAREGSLIAALLRRLTSWLKDIHILRTDFVFTATDAGGRQQLAGHLRRRTAVVDRYELDLSPDAEGRFDRRLAVALAVLLAVGRR